MSPPTDNRVNDCYRDSVQISDEVQHVLDELARQCLQCGQGIPLPIAPPSCEPHLGKLRNTRSQETRLVVENLIRTRSGCKNLRKILLLITPLELPNEQKNRHKVHCYRLDSRRHRGVTTVTQEDLRLIERYHRPDNYSIVYCNRHIQHEDAVRNSPIRAQIFELVREAPKAIRRTWYRGHVVRLNYRSSGPRRVGDSPSKGNAFGIRSLEQPKIQVKLQGQVPRESSDEDIQQGRRQCLQRNLQWEFQYASQQNLNEELEFNPGNNDGAFQQEQQWDQMGDHERNFTVNVSEERSSQVEADEVQVILKPQQLKESVGEIHLSPPMSLDFDSIIHKSSTTFTRLMGPPVLPASFSVAAFSYLEQRLRSPSARDAFSKLGLLVGEINKEIYPLEEHLLRFFHVAEFLDFKMYVWQESRFRGWPTTPEPRYRIDCYVFDNRKEYVASICLLQTQLKAMSRIFPKARRNFRYIDAFQLTPVPLKLTKWLKVALDALHARSVYELLGELALDYIRPKAAIFELPNLTENEDENSNFCI